KLLELLGELFQLGLLGVLEPLRLLGERFEILQAGFGFAPGPAITLERPLPGVPELGLVILLGVVVDGVSEHLFGVAVVSGGFARRGRGGVVSHRGCFSFAGGTAIAAVVGPAVAAEPRSALQRPVGPPGVRDQRGQTQLSGPADNEPADLRPGFLGVGADTPNSPDRVLEVGPVPDREPAATLR